MGQSSAGQRIVVLVADNDATCLAVQLLTALVRPGRDHVVLVTVVPHTLAEAGGRALLRRHEAALQQTCVAVSCELLVGGPGTTAGRTATLFQCRSACISLEVHAKGCVAGLWRLWPLSLPSFHAGSCCACDLGTRHQEARACARGPSFAQTKNLSGTLTDQLELYCDAVDAHLVVMGSQVGEGRTVLGLRPRHELLDNDAPRLGNELTVR